MFMFLFISENIHSQQDTLNSLESSLFKKTIQISYWIVLVCYKDGSPHWREYIHTMPKDYVQSYYLRFYHQ